MAYTRRRSGTIRWIALLVQIVHLVVSVFALILVVHIGLVVFEANPTNSFAEFIADLARALNVGFEDLFTPESVKWRVTLNFGLAAILWLVVGAIVIRLLQALGRSAL